MSARVRTQWVEKVVARMQAAIGDLLIAEPKEAHRRIKRLIRGVPSAHGPIERALMRGFLLELVCQVGRHVHQRECRAGGCSFAEGDFIRVFLTAREKEPQQALCTWADEYFKSLARVHPDSPTRQAARYIRKHFSERFDSVVIGNAVGRKSVVLRREFAQEYGVSMRDYHAAARLVGALDHLGDEKLEVVAATVGYRSKKNFFRAFSKLTGLTPNAFRKLIGHERRAAIEAAHMALNVRPWKRTTPLVSDAAQLY